uniref:Uncharacterized protein n=1 Tax=uncultured bacterium Contig643 TaxID=1393602 RepID=W0FML7_9BACT|nr:hypothetical protein [uncultured bacterium Contig643]
MLVSSNQNRVIGVGGSPSLLVEEMLLAPLNFLRMFEVVACFAYWNEVRSLFAGHRISVPSAERQLWMLSYMIDVVHGAQLPLRSVRLHIVASDHALPSADLTLIVIVLQYFVLQLDPFRMLVESPELILLDEAIDPFDCDLVCHCLVLQKKKTGAIPIFDLKHISTEISCM